MAGSVKGQCLCGAVSFEVQGELPNLYQCHCSLCRKATGAAANAATIVAEHAFRWLSGEGQISSFVKPTGYRSDFCSACGSPVPNRLRGMSKVWVPAGLLDEQSEVTIAVHLHWESAAAWERDTPQCLHLDGGPQDLVSLENELQQVNSNSS